MKFMPIWYDQDEVKKEGPAIEAANEEEARKKAYEAYNGNPPAPLLTLNQI